MVTDLRIGELAKRSGITVETVRYYERRGLLAKPRRLVSGYRSFPPEAIRRIRFVRRARELGFSLNEIAELLSLRVRKGARCQLVRSTAERRRRDVESKIARLTAVHAALAKLIAACSEQSATDDCPILAALEGEQDWVERETAH